jgi:hypothetical protein
MSRTEWSELLIKIFAIVQIFGGFFSVTVFVGAYAIFVPALAQNQVQIPFIFVLPFLGMLILPVIAGIIIWRKATTISNWMWLDTQPNNKGKRLKVPGPNLFQIKKAAIAGIGLYIFITRIPAIVNSIGDFILRWQQFSQFGENALDFFQLSEYINLFAIFLGLFVAIILIASPTRIIVFLDKIQNTWDLLIE